MWVLQHHSVHAFDMSTIIVFVYLGLQIKWNQFSSSNSHHTSCIHNGLHAEKWPDLMTSEADSVSALGYHWTEHTGRPGRPLEPQDYTGMPLEPHWLMLAPSGVPVAIQCLHNWNTLEHHWKATGRPLEAHWKHTGYQQFFSSGTGV